MRADGLALMALATLRFTFDFWRFYDPAWLRLGSQGLAVLIFGVGLLLVLKGKVPDLQALPATS